MKVYISMRTINGYKKYPAEAYPAFEKHGYMFVVSRGLNVKRDGTFCGYNRKDWRVSEVETGALVAQDEKFHLAFQNAQNILQDKTKTELKKAIKAAKKEALQ